MNRILPLLSLVGSLLLISCSTAIDAPVGVESLVLVYVEEFHKTISKPPVDLRIEGRDDAVRFKLDAPAAVARIEGGSDLRASGWTGGGNTIVDGSEDFVFSAPAGSVSLLPWKIMLVNRNLMQVRPMTEQDLQYARGLIAEDKAFSGLKVTYPELSAE